MDVSAEFNLLKEKVKRYEDMFAPWMEEISKRKDTIHEQGKEIAELQDKLDDSTRNAAALTDQAKGLKEAVVSYRDNYETCFHGKKELQEKLDKQKEELTIVLNKVRNIASNIARRTYCKTAISLCDEILGVENDERTES